MPGGLGARRQHKRHTPKAGEAAVAGSGGCRRRGSLLHHATTLLYLTSPHRTATNVKVGTICVDVLSNSRGYGIGSVLWARDAPVLDRGYAECELPRIHLPRLYENGSSKV